MLELAIVVEGFQRYSPLFALLAERYPSTVMVIVLVGDVPKERSAWESSDQRDGRYVQFIPLRRSPAHPGTRRWYFETLCRSLHQCLPQKTLLLAISNHAPDVSRRDHGSRTIIQIDGDGDRTRLYWQLRCVLLLLRPISVSPSEESSIKLFLTGLIYDSNRIRAEQKLDGYDFYWADAPLDRPIPFDMNMVGWYGKLLSDSPSIPLDQVRSYAWSEDVKSSTLFAFLSTVGGSLVATSLATYPPVISSPPLW